MHRSLKNAKSSQFRETFSGFSMLILRSLIYLKVAQVGQLPHFHRGAPWHND